MALANANRAHGEIAARLTIAFQRSALAEAWPPSPEPMSKSGGLPRCIFLSRLFVALCCLDVRKLRHDPVWSNHLAKCRAFHPRPTVRVNPKKLAIIVGGGTPMPWNAEAILQQTGESAQSGASTASQYYGLANRSANFRRRYFSRSTILGDLNQRYPERCGRCPYRS
jgi:hypothetical protein